MGAPNPNLLGAEHIRKCNGRLRSRLDPRSSRRNIRVDLETTNHTENVAENRKWVKRLNKEKMAGIVALAMLLVSLVGIQQAFATRSEEPPPISGLIKSVSDPLGQCLDLGLKGWYGTVTISLSRLWIFLQDANPNSTYIVWVGYVQTGGVCGGTWRPIGSVNTDSAGRGTSVQWFSPPRGYCVFELKDSAGNIVYGTNALAL